MRKRKFWTSSDAANASTTIGDTVRQRKDGSLINVSLTVSPVRDAAGKIVGASKIVLNQ